MLKSIKRKKLSNKKKNKEKPPLCHEDVYTIKQANIMKANLQTMEIENSGEKIKLTHGNINSLIRYMNKIFCHTCKTTPCD